MDILKGKGDLVYLLEWLKWKNQLTP
jgi:hypothetical protein